jgi:hypothetical protein
MQRPWGKKTTKIKMVLSECKGMRECVEMQVAEV